MDISKKEQRAARLNERASSVIARWRRAGEPRLTREQLAATLETSVSTVVRWESPTHANPRFSEIWAMEAVKPGLVEALFETKQVEFEIPVKTVSEANMRSHWSAKAKRTKTARSSAKLHTIAGVQKGVSRKTSPKDLLKQSEIDSPIEVLLTRLAPGQLDDDNLAGALKAVRDGVADAFGVDDGVGPLKWKYAQQRSKTYAVQVTLRWKPAQVGSENESE